LAGSASAASRFRGQALSARVASGLLLAAVSLGAAWVGGLPFALVLGVVILGALWEFLRLGARAGHPVLRLSGLAAAAVMVAWAARPDLAAAGPVLFALVLAMIGISLRPPIEGRLLGLALTVFGVLYTAGLGIHLLWLRKLDSGWIAIVLVLLGTWAADTFAFFVGVRWGRRRLAPHVSPHKSVEGLIGGLAGSVVVVVAAARWFAPELGLSFAALLGLVVGAAAPLGDLLESLIKRNLGAKDMSRVIPGHGGILDRIDSLLLAGPAAYYVFRFFGS
jgi:phosphatidate cytidylyltransferase